MPITAENARAFQAKGVLKRQQNVRQLKEEASKIPELHQALVNLASNVISSHEQANNDDVSALRAHIKRIDDSLKTCVDAKDFSLLMRSRMDAVTQLSMALTGGKPPTNKARGLGRRSAPIIEFPPESPSITPEPQPGTGLEKA